MKTKSTSPTVYLCCSAMMCLAISVNLPPVFLTTFGETFGVNGDLTSEQLGRIPAAIFSAMVIGIVFAGPLVDRWGARLFAILGLGFITLGLASLGCAPNFTVLLMAASLLGLGAACMEVVLSPIVAAAKPEQRTSALNKLHLFYCIGAVITVLIGSAALYLDISWRTICLTILIFPILISVGFFMIHPPTIVHQDKSRTSLRYLIRHPFVLAAALAIFLGGATEVGLAQWLPAYAERGLGYSKSSGGAALAVFSIAMGMGRYVVSQIVHRTGTIPLMMFCCMIIFLLFIVGCFSPSAPIALAACVSIGLVVGCLWPSTLAVASDRFPDGGASLFAILAASGNIGCVLMPWLIGFITEQSNPRYGLISTAVCPLLLVFLLMWMHRVVKRHNSGI